MRLLRILGLPVLMALLCLSSAFAAPRFSDHGDETVTDTLTGLTWTKNANVAAEPMPWDYALAYVALLNDAGYLGHNDWRQPTVDELLSLVDPARSNPALPAGHPFVGVQINEYWSSSAGASSYYYAFGVNMGTGESYSGHKYNDGYVWPVRGVQTGAMASLTLSPAGRDFGTLPVNTSSDPQAFTLGNTGTVPLVVRGMATTGGDSTLFSIATGTCGSLTPTIAPGTSCTISVTFSPTTTGAKSTSLTIPSSDPATPLKSAPLSGTGIDTPPSLRVSTLADGRATNSAGLNIAGTATDASGIRELTIAGTPVPVAQDGSFSHLVVLQPGMTAITTVATDTTGNRMTDTRHITLDQQLPALTIAGPADNSTANRDFVTVTGTISPPVASVEVVVNGGSAQLATLNEASYTATVNLAAGLNTIEVTVTDLSGKTNTLKRTVVSDGQHPTVNILTPPRDIRTTDASQVITGTIADEVPPVTVSVSDGFATYAPAVTGGSFSQALTLTDPKEYPIEVTVTENNGTTTTVRRNILFEKTAEGAGITGAFYSSAFLSPAGTPPHAWALASGSLPAGLTLNPATGAITGTPAKSGVYSFTVRVVDAVGTTEVLPRAITITDVACGNAAVRIAAPSPVPYADIPGAYAQAVDNDVIQLQTLDFTADACFDRNIRVSLRGGYDCAYTANGAAAGILGNMRVTGGTVKVENLRFR